jgi:hypothetical protein
MMGCCEQDNGPSASTNVGILHDLSKLYLSSTEIVNSSTNLLHKTVVQFVKVYSSPDIIRVNKLRRMRWTRHVAQIRERRCTYRIFVGKHDGRWQTGWPRHRLEDNIKTYTV